MCPRLLRACLLPGGLPRLLCWSHVLSGVAGIRSGLRAIYCHRFITRLGLCSVVICCLETRQRTPFFLKEPLTGTMLMPRRGMALLLRRTGGHAYELHRDARGCHLKGRTSFASTSVSSTQMVHLHPSTCTTDGHANARSTHAITHTVRTNEIPRAAMY